VQTYDQGDGNRNEQWTVKFVENGSRSGDEDELDREDDSEGYACSLAALSGLIAIQGFRKFRGTDEAGPLPVGRIANPKKNDPNSDMIVLLFCVSQISWQV
jgi:hypothetical protein